MDLEQPLGEDTADLGLRSAGPGMHRRERRELPVEDPGERPSSADAVGPTLRREELGAPGKDLRRALRCAMLDGAPEVVVSDRPDMSGREPARLSRERWLDPDPIPHLPTPQELSGWLREGLADAATPGVAAAARAARALRPDANDPVSMVAAAHVAGWDRAAPQTYTKVGRRVVKEGELLVVDVDAVHALHAKDCVDCTSGRPCYWSAACNLIAEVDWPFKDGAPEKGPPDDGSGTVYDPQLAALVAQAAGLGVVEVAIAEEVTWWNPALNGHKLSVQLAADVATRIKEDTSGATTAVESTRVASEFLREMDKATDRGLKGDAAWRAAESATFSTAPRLVVDMSDVSEQMRTLEMRYSTLRGLVQRARGGGFLMKADLRKGFWQLPLAQRAKRATAFWVRMAPGAPPTAYWYTRAPMGAGYIPWVFSLFSGMVLQLTRKRLRPGVLMDVYADDFFWHALSEADALHARDCLLAVLAEIGSADNEKKRSVAPATREAVLGVEVATDPPGVRLPAEAMVKAHSLVLVLHAFARRHRPVPARIIAGAAGRIVWLSCVDPRILPRARSLMRCLGSVHPRWYKFKSSLFSWKTAGWGVKVRKEVEWLAGHLAVSGMQRLLPPPPQKRLYPASDASGRTNVVAIHAATFAIRFHLVDCAGLALAMLEFLAVPLLEAHLGRRLADVTLFHASDALGTLYWAASGRAARDEANDLCIARAEFERRHNLVVVERWLSRDHLYVPDRAAAKPWEELLGDELAATPLPKLLIDVEVRGLPHKFLSDWAVSTREFDPDFTFSEEAWTRVNQRE